MSGLTKICRAYGAIIVNGQKYVWDYVNEVAVPESEMPPRSKRAIESERQKWAEYAAVNASTAQKNNADK
jgi:hypothetical protein